MSVRLRRVVAIAALSLALSAGARAQTPVIRGFVDTGMTFLSASQSFEAISDSRSAPQIGGGADVLVASNVSIAFRVARLRKEGERVFVFNGDTFPLGIASTITVVPIELGAAYRFPLGRSRVTPYAGGGIGWHRYSETSDFAEADENVKQTFTGYHVLGGAEFRILRWLGVGGEAQWTTVPDALGDDPNSVSAAFDEKNLGGTTFRIKFTVGR